MQTKQLSLTHLVRAPLRPNPAPPLLVLAHGFGSNEEDLMGLAASLDPRLLIVSVRAPRDLGMGRYAWFDLEMTPNGVRADPEEMTQGLLAFTDFLAEMPEAYQHDPERVLIGGFSQGAIVSLGALLRRPRSLGGVLALSGRLWPGLLAEADRAALAGKPVFVSHGIYDPVLPIANGREIREALSALPVELTYREYPMAHEINADALRDILAWLSAWMARGAAPSLRKEV